MKKKNRFPIYFIILFLCGMPWIIAYWPGTVQYDSCGQLLQYLGVGRMTGHHPYPVTMLMGAALSVGRGIFHSDNMGIFIYVIFQFIIQCLVISHILSIVTIRRKLPKIVLFLIIFFYAVFPLVPNWGISFGKDTGYYTFYLLFIAEIIEIFIEDTEFNLLHNILFVISAVGIICFRNDGRYIIYLTLILLFILNKKMKKLIFITGSTVLVVLIMIEGIIMPLQKIPKGSIREMMSVPLLQTARYIKEYPQEVSNEEQEIISNLFMVEEYTELGEKYDRMISDWIKEDFIEYPGKRQLLSYAKLWYTQFRRHPGLYLKVFVEHCSGYFNPMEPCYKGIVGWFKMLDSDERTDQFLSFYFIPEMKSLRNMMEKWTEIWVNTPILLFLFRPGFYTWFMFILLFVAMKQNGKKIFSVFFPEILVLLIAIVSPLNASIRYFLPVMVTMPILVCMCFKRERSGL